MGCTAVVGQRDGWIVIRVGPGVDDVPRGIDDRVAANGHAESDADRARAGGISNRLPVMDASPLSCL